ncbi:MAG TPA: DUF3048 domain-containing protein [Oceanobacillus sp.]|nr:DUF3048 domain-containing protein [Oceanobacillus sp.]
MSRLIGILIAVLLLVPGFASAQGSMLGPYVYPEGVNPFTGLPVENPENLNRRPLIVKISNYPPVVRPQWGLNAADMVWELVVEGGVTRFAAIYLSEDFARVGPVRSARLGDFDLVRIYNALYAHSGSSVGTLERIRADPVISSRSLYGGGCPPLCRIQEPGVAYEHTLFADTAALREDAVARRRDVTPDPVYGMAFSLRPPSGGLPLTGARIYYSQTNVEWQYDRRSGRWLRSQDGEPHFDAMTETQISAANVLIVEANHIEQPIVYDGYWGAANFAFTVELSGTGRAVLLRDGQMFEGQWRRENISDPLTYYDMEGNTLPFKLGNTFVQLVPRWRNGYQLAFLLQNPLTATVIIPDGANMRTGPATGYNVITRANGNDSFPAIGRNGAGTWVQVLRPDGSLAWLAMEVIQLDGDVMTLPQVRSTFEG